MVRLGHSLLVEDMLFTILFPLRLDDRMMEIKTGWPALVKNTRNVGDFSQ